MSRRLQIKVVSFAFVLVCLVGSAAHCFELTNLQHSAELDTAYLPYRFQMFRDIFIEDDCSYPENTLFKVVRPAIEGSTPGLMILSNNPSPNNAGVSMFTPRTIPEFEVPDDDPVRHTITNWDLYAEPTTNEPLIAGICHTDDSIFAFTLNTITDAARYSLIHLADSKRKLIPGARNIFFGDMNNDSLYELVMYVELHGRFRRLYCLDYITLSVNWFRDVSSGINPDYMVIDNPGNKSEILFVTGNPANGISDSIFNDRYSYLSRINGNGEIRFSKKIGVYGREVSELTPSDANREFFLTHYLDLETADSLTGKNRDQYFLSRIDTEGKALKTITIRSTPLYSWIIRDQDNVPFLFVVFRSKEVSMFDMGLNLVEEIDALPSVPNYFGKARIADLEDSVHLFSNGIYNKNLTKILQFPFSTYRCDPIVLDTNGLVSALIVEEHYHWQVGNIQKKTALELVSVYYHRNQIYVIIVLTGLFVGLVTTAYYQRKSSNTAQLITRQKRELEKTHFSLKEAQARIIAQEKYEQAQGIAGGFAHEIRNRLFPARSALSKLAEQSISDPMSPEQTARLAKFSDEAVSRAIGLTQLISQYSSLEEIKTPEPVNLYDLINEIVISNRPECENLSIRIETTVGSNVIVSGNRDQLYLVFNNIVRNAIDELSETPNPSIGISTARQGDYWCCQIVDNGPGVPSDNIERVFDMFYSTKPSTGAGIGLAMCKKIVEMYDGEISVGASTEGGASFCVKLPGIDTGKNLNTDKGKEL